MEVNCQHLLGKILVLGSEYSEVMHFSGVVYSTEELWVNIFIAAVHWGGSIILPDDLTVKSTKTSPIPQTSQAKNYHFVEDVKTSLQKLKGSMVKVKWCWEGVGNGWPHKICEYFLLIDTARFELGLFPVLEKSFWWLPPESGLSCSAGDLH